MSRKTPLKEGASTDLRKLACVLAFESGSCRTLSCSECVFSSGYTPKEGELYKAFFAVLDHIEIIEVK